MSKSGDGRSGGKGPGIRDLLLWKAFTHDIDPLDGHPDWAALEDSLSQNSPFQNKARPSEIVLSPPSKSPDTKTTETSVQLDRRTEDKLRKGKLPIEATLDLHGYTQDQAYEAFTQFISRCAAQGKRCVLVITGKGTQKSSVDDVHPDPSRRGVLRQRVPEWAGVPPVSKDILKVVSAQQKDGGSGAFYVYLKRQR